MTRSFDPAVYWKLRAVCTDTQRALAVAQQAQAVFAAATAKQAALLAELGLDAKAASFQLDDDALSVTFPEPGG